MKYHNYKDAQEISQSLRDSRKFHSHRVAQGSSTVREAPGSGTIIQRSQGGHNHEVIGPRRFATECFGPERSAP